MFARQSRFCQLFGRFQPYGYCCLLVDVSDIFYFFLLGEGEWGARGAGREGGSVFLYWKSRAGGGGSSGREGPRGREGVCSDLGNWGGGPKYFFWGAEMSTKAWFCCLSLLPHAQRPRNHWCRSGGVVGALNPRKMSKWQPMPYKNLLRLFLGNGLRRLK